MPSTPPPGKRNGASRPGRITKSTTRSAFSPRPRSWMAWSTFGCRDSNFYALDARNGPEEMGLQQQRIVGHHFARRADGKVYFATSDTAMFYALDAKSGAPVFSLKLQVADVFFARDRRQHALHRLARGKADRPSISSQKLAWTFQTDASRQMARHSRSQTELRIMRLLSPKFL